MVIGLITPSNANIPLGFVKSLLSVTNPVITQEGSSIPDNRNNVFERARIIGEDLLFIDSDMVFTVDNVNKIEELLKDKDIVTGLCAMAYEGNHASLFKEEHGTYKIIKPEKELFEIDACGCAFLGISKKVLDTLTEPFNPIKHEVSGQYYGEDVSFCIRAKENGFKIYCDPLINIGHIKPFIKYVV